MKLLADLSPLRESPPFRRLWAGSTLSLTGSALTRFAAVLQVYDTTHSTAAVGLIGLAVMVPLLVVGLLGGALIDTADRRMLVLASTAGNMVVAAAIAAQAYLHLSQVWPLFLLLAAQSAIGGINEPARRALIPALLSGDQLAAGLALQRLTGQITLIAGPALAGIIVATPHLGLGGCYLIDTVSFTAALYGTWRLPRVRADKTNSSERTRLSAVIAGFSFIGRTPVVAGAFIADVNATFFGLPTALFPAINAERFGGDPRTLGLFTASIGVGGLIAAVLSGPVGHVSRQGLAMLVTVTIWGAGFAVFAVAPWLWLTLLSLGVAGAADTGTVVLRGLIVQTVTPDEFRGRVTAADYVVGAGGGQLGSLESGVLGSLTTPEISALSGGLLTIVGAVVIGAALPAFARYRAPATAPVVSPAGDVTPA